MTPVFVTFIPAVGCNSNVFVNMLFSTLRRCRLAEEVLLGTPSDVRIKQPDAYIQDTIQAESLRKITGRQEIAYSTDDFGVLGS